MPNNGSSAGNLPPSNVLITETLARRPFRAPSLNVEDVALGELARHLAKEPSTILQSLVDKAMELTGAGSSGISIDESDNGEPVFRWHAVAGRFKPHLHATLPRDFSPCGVVLDQDCVQLMADPERHYEYIKSLGVPIHEVLLVPFFKNGKSVGTIWVVSHDASKEFDAEDSRILHSLADFTSSALGLYTSLNR